MKRRIDPATPKRREVLIPPMSRPRGMPTTARGRLMFPKPKVRRLTPRATLPAWASLTKAERLVDRVLSRAHLVAITPSVRPRDECYILALVVTKRDFEKLCEHGEERADLEPEEDLGAEDIPHDDDDPAGGAAEDENEYAPYD